MAKSPSHPTFVPKDSPRVIPRIFTDDVRALVAFIKRVFGADGRHQSEFPMQLRIGDALIMISDTSFRKPMGAFLYVYVEDTDATYRRAVRAGARSVEAPPTCRTAIAAACSMTTGATRGRLQLT